MKKFRGIVHVCIALLTVSAFGFANAAPRIESENPTWDFKKIKEGEKISHIFKIKNAGDEMLEIKKVRASCGCTAVAPVKKSLKPGEEAEIKVTFNSDGYSGKQTKYVYVHSNDPKNAMLNLKFTGEIQRIPAPRITISPPSWYMQEIERGKTSSMTASIKNGGEKPLDIKSITTSGDALKAELLGQKTIPPGGESKVKLTYTPGAKTGPISEKMIVESNDPRRSRLTYYVRGRMKSQERGVTISVLGVRQQKDNTQVDFNFHNTGNRPVRIEIPDATSPNYVTVSPRSYRKFSAKIPTERLESPKPSTATGKTGHTDSDNYKNLHVEITFPIPAPR